MAKFEGLAPVGAYGAENGFALVCCRSFGAGEDGRLSASFALYEVGPPLSAEACAAGLADAVRAELSGATGPEIDELCASHGCTAAGLFEEMLGREAEGGVRAGFAARADALPFGEGDPVAYLRAFGQVDRLGAVERAFVGREALLAMSALWPAHAGEALGDGDAGLLDAAVSALESAPAPMEAVREYARERGLFGKGE